MARFFLHLYNAIGEARDPEGQELPDLEAARQSALAGVRSIISSEAREGRIDLRGRVEIVGEQGATLLVVSFEDAFELHLQGGDHV
jgi:hypothetical protein